MPDEGTNKIVIFLDMDGVISDIQSHGEATDKFKDNGQLDYDDLDHEWWVSMPAFEGAEDFYQDLKKYGTVKFLTAPTGSAECFGGKAEWITNFPTGRGRWALMDLIICPSKDKYLLAEPDRILIDDRQSNIDDWIAAGGIGILHEGDFQQTLAKLDEVINGPDSRPSLPKLTPQ